MSTCKGAGASGHAIELSGDGQIDVPINATLGSEQHDNMPSSVTNDNETTTYSVVNTSSFDLAVTSVGTNDIRPSMLPPVSTDLEADKIYSLTFDAIVNSGTPIISNYYDGKMLIPINHKVVNGTNSIDYKIGSGSSPRAITAIYFDGTSLFDVSITNYSIKEIQSVQGSVTYYDHTKLKHVQIGADGVGSEELVVNGDFSDGSNGWTLANTIVENERLRLPSPIVDYARAKVDVVVVPEIPYVISMNYYNKVGKVRISIPGVVDLYSDSSSGDGVYSATHTAIPNKPYVLDVNNVNDDNAKWDVDNVSLKQALPLSTNYPLKDGTYGHFVVLHTNHFTDADMALIDAHPETLTAWALGHSGTGISIAKGKEDKYYALTEN